MKHGQKSIGKVLYSNVTDKKLTCQAVIPIYSLHQIPSSFRLHVACICVVFFYCLVFFLYRHYLGAKPWILHHVGEMDVEKCYHWLPLAGNLHIVKMFWWSRIDLRVGDGWGQFVGLEKSQILCSIEVWLSYLAVTVSDPSLTPVASLGWVTPGAATEGVTSLFFSWKTWRPFLLIVVTITIAFLLISLRYYPPCRVSPCTFFTCPTSFLHYSL